MPCRFALVCCCALAAAGQDAHAADYAQLILADKPVAYWQCNEKSGKNLAAAAIAGQDKDSLNLLAGKLTGAMEVGRDGPRPPKFLDFGDENRAIQFEGRGGAVRVTDPGDGSVLDFTNGDSLTLEAWVSLYRIAEGQQVYVIGKGRTKNKGFAADNQNYALRLRGVPDAGTGAAAISFLFRDDDNRPGQEADWHRWTSHANFLEGSGWHHVAVTYTFGRSTSLRGYIDGVEVEGAWDMGGASDQAPIVDNDELWLGSSMGAAANSSLNGAIDEAAIYRTALAPERIRKRVRVAREEAPAAKIEAQAGEVLVEILEGAPDKRSWDFAPPQLTQQYLERAFAFVGVPKKYNRKGIVVDRSSPFVVRATGEAALPAGSYRFLVRARGGARLFIDEKEIVATPFPIPNGDGHEEVPLLPPALEPDLREMPVGHREAVETAELDGKPHRFRLETLVGGRGLRPELGETSVSFAPAGEPFRLLSDKLVVPHSDLGWAAYSDAQRLALEQQDRQARQAASAETGKYWQTRHDQAREYWAAQASPTIPCPATDRAVLNDIDRFVNSRLEQANLSPAELTDDASFLRRLTLDTAGVIPTPQEMAAFLADKPEVRRRHAIDRLLTDPRWADHWTSYWQDVLAENPGLLKPMLNNTGPFRYWIYESFLDNKPLDRFVAELVSMEGSRLGGGPAGFAMATQNDSPMAAKAHIVAKAFLGMEMQCARCHDAPYHPFKQEDTFSLAAMLNQSPLKVPLTSTVKLAPGARKPLIQVTLAPGSEVRPEFPFADLLAPDATREAALEALSPREQLAALLTAPQNERFAQVAANRLWKRFLGRGIVDPVDDWHQAAPSNPELLSFLGRELAMHDYDLQQLAKLIFNSHTYQRAVTVVDSSDPDKARALFATPTRRRLTAEQIVDSLFLAVDKQFRCEELNLDPDCRRPMADFLNLGVPRRAWQFASLSNERDRPALALPVAQSILDVLTTFGWRESRQNPLTERETDAMVLQPLILANGTAGSRISRLSDDSAVTALCLEDQPIEQLVDRVYRQILSRDPTSEERTLFVDLLSEGYSQRQAEQPTAAAKRPSAARHAVSWSNHLSPEATRIKLELEKAARAGDPPTAQLQVAWRERMEDMLWSLVNSPEFAFVP